MDQILKNRELIDDCYLHIFNSDEGQIVLNDLQNHCFYNASTTTGAVTEFDVYVNEGMRKVVLKILGTIAKAKKRNNS